MINYAEFDDAHLVIQAKDDPAAFGELYERYVTRIYNYIYYRTSNHHDAEDLTAKVFMRAMNHIPHYDERGVPFSAWLYKIAHNLVANWHRDHSRRKIIPLEDFLGSNQHDHPEDLTEEAEERQRLLESIQKLPSERQQLLILKYVEHLSNAEIGAIMDKSEGAIKSLYYRTLASLRDDLQPEQGIEEGTS